MRSDLGGYKFQNIFIPNVIPNLIPNLIPNVIPTIYKDGASDVDNTLYLR